MRVTRTLTLLCDTSWHRENKYDITSFSFFFFFFFFFGGGCRRVVCACVCVFKEMLAVYFEYDVYRGLL